MGRRKNGRYICLVKTILFTVICVIFFRGQAEGQPSEYRPQTGIRAAYLGSVIYPGFKIGLEKPYKVTQKDKLTTKKVNTLYKERYFSYSLGMYHQWRYHSHYFLQAEWVKRRQKSKGFYYEGSLGAGASRTFIDGPAYTVTDHGDIRKALLPGNGFAHLNMGGGMGYHGHFRLQKPVTIYLKHHWHFFFPYNGLVTPRLTIELGINYLMSDFWQANPTFKYQQKQSRKYRKQLLTP
jgi:hypothetical protein